MIQKSSVSRLYQYRKSLYRLKQLGFVRVFSDNLADAVGVTPVQVRRDFSVFGITGNKRGGYSVQDLIESLDKKLGKDKVQRVIVVGAGNIGKALLSYKGFEAEGMKVVAAFESDETKCNPDLPTPILPISQMKSFIQKNKIEVGVIAVPDIYAQQVFDQMLAAGIKGVLNFAPIRLSVPNEDIVINSVNVGLELEKIIYLVSSLNRKENGS